MQKKSDCMEYFEDRSLILPSFITKVDTSGLQIMSAKEVRLFQSETAVTEITTVTKDCRVAFLNAQHVKP